MNEYFLDFFLSLAVVMFGEKMTLEGKEVLICGFLSHRIEAEWRRACGVFLSRFGRLKLF